MENGRKEIGNSLRQPISFFIFASFVLELSADADQPASLGRLARQRDLTD